MSYAAQLSTLNAAIIDGETSPALRDIKPARHDAITPETRLAVYTDGYRERLLKAIFADYPALTHYVGEEPLTKAILAYIRAQPSRVWDLNQYPIGFAAFFAAQTNNRAASALAFLESAIAEVFWLPESTPLDAASLATLPPEALDGFRFTPRAALQLLQLDAAAHAYLQQFRDGSNPATIEDGLEYLCVLRHANEVRRVPLEAAEHTLLSRLLQGTPLGQALEEMPEMALAEKLPEYLARWLAHGCFAASPGQAAG